MNKASKRVKIIDFFGPSKLRRSSYSQDPRDADHVARDLSARELPPGHDEAGADDADDAGHDAADAAQAARGRGLDVELVLEVLGEELEESDDAEEERHRREQVQSVELLR